MFAVMWTWSRGQKLLTAATTLHATPFELLLEGLQRNPPHRLRAADLFLAQEADGGPLVLLHHLENDQVLHDNVVLITIKTAEVPVVAFEARVTGRFGFMEEPDLRMFLQRAAHCGVAQRPQRDTLLGHPPSRVVELGTRVEL